MTGQIARAREEAGDSMALPAWSDAFFRTLAGTGDPVLAARAAGRAIGTVRNWRSKDEEFARRWEQALDGAPEPEPTPAINVRLWSTTFLTVLRSTGNIRAACQQAGIARSTAYEARTSDPTFRREWDEAIEDAVDLLEIAARNRAISGGSDRLMELLLKAHRPDVYGDRLRIERNIRQQSQDVYDRAIARGDTPEEAREIQREFELLAEERFGR